MLKIQHTQPHSQRPRVYMPEFGRLTTASRRFFKGHGHGNDYLVFQAGTDWAVTPEAVRQVCHRTRGVGSDGVVVLAAPRDEGGGDAPFPSLRMFNPDGGAFERSGNGLRIAAAALWHWGLVQVGSFVLDCWGAPIPTTVAEIDADGGVDVAVDLGRAQVGAAAVALDSGALAGPRGVELDGVGVSVGNPHFVVFGTDMTDQTLHELGPYLASHPRFASGANVQLANVRDGVLRIRIWERGVGRTSASGTSASASAVAAVHTGRLAAGTHQVAMDGGTFSVRVTPDLEVRLRGPVYGTQEGRLLPGFLAGLAGQEPVEGF